MGEAGGRTVRRGPTRHGRYDASIFRYFWAHDSERILYRQDEDGDENFRIYAVDPTAEPDEDTDVPPARDLTPLDGVRAEIIVVPKATPGSIIIGLNDCDPRFHDVYRLDLETGERELIIHNEDNVAGWQTDLDGNVRLAVRQNEEGGTDIRRIDGDEFIDKPVYSCTTLESCSPIRFHKDGKHVYMTTNRGDDVDLSRLVFFNPQTQDKEIIESDPKGEVDFGGTVFSNATDELIATYYVSDRLRYEPKREQFERDLKLLRSTLPEGDIYFGSSTHDESKQIVQVQRDVDPGSTYLYDREAGTVEHLYRSRPELPIEHLAPMKPIRYKARDGLTIPAYLTVAKGIEAENLPTVVIPHGGPWIRDRWGYNPYVQFLANRGYAVLQPNFRGSAGFGKAFLNAGNRQWGDAMQDDITDGVQYLIDEGIADPHRIGIYGRSYGGYFLLARGEVSRWHRVDSDEAWHYYEGDPLELLEADPQFEQFTRTILGPVSEGVQPVHVVPAKAWQAACSTGAYTLVGCTVGPGFEFADFQMLSELPADSMDLRTLGSRKRSAIPSRLAL